MYIYKRIDNLIETRHFHNIVELERNIELVPYTEEEISNLLKHHICFACFFGDEIIAYISMLTNSAYFNGSYYISSINVHKNHRRKKIATSLINCVLHYCIIYKKSQTISLDVEKTNLEAIKLYKSLGFHTSTIESLNGKNDLVMYKFF